MLAKKVKEMLAKVPDCTNICMYMNDDNDIVRSEVLDIFQDEEDGEWGIFCNAWEKESPEDIIERLEAEKEEDAKKYEALKATFEELEKQYSTFTTAMATKNGWNLQELQQEFVEKFNKGRNK